MEYFAAYELTRRHDRPEQVAKAILPHVAAAEWEIVAELAVQIADKHSKDGAARILRTLLSNKRFRGVASRYNITRFAMRCLGFVHVPVPLAEEVGRSFTESTLGFVAARKQIQPERCSVVPELQQPVETEILGVLRAAVTGEVIDLRGVAAEVITNLPELMSGSQDRRASGGDYERWQTHRRNLWPELRSEILSVGEEGVWFAAWREGLISLEQLLVEGPDADRYPLSVLFRDIDFQYVGPGWGDWGSFIPELLLQSDTDPEPDFPVTLVELDWLGGFIDSLGVPPWVVQPRNVELSLGFEGDFQVHKLATDQGWTLFRLMLVGIEAQNPRSPKPPDATSLGYYDVVDALACRRQEGISLPTWLSQVIEDLPPERRDLVTAWLNREVDFVAH